MLGLLLAAQIVATANFEGGNIGKVEIVAPAHLRCAVQGQSDQDHRNRQANWYYFRLDNLPRRRPVIVDLVNLAGEYDYHGPAFSVDKATRPVFSYDGRYWEHFRDYQVHWDERDLHLSLHFIPEAATMWIAHVAPYTTQDLARLLDSVRGSPYLTREVIGRSVEGRNLLLLTITGSEAPPAQKKVVWLMFRQHAWEAGSSWACEGVVRFLLSGDPRAAAIRERTIFKIFPMADPDGVVHGGVRFNRNGYDLNRNWNAVDTEKMPEIAAQRKAILDWVDAGGRVDVFLTLHNTESGEYLEAPSTFQPLGQRLFQLLTASTSFNPTMPLREIDLSATAVKPGRMNVAEGLFHDRQLPAMLMEQMVEHDSKLGGCPTVADRIDFGGGLVRALAEAVDSGYRSPEASSAEAPAASGFQSRKR